MASSLKKKRLELDLTQAELAQRVGTSQAQIYRLENSERKLTVEWAERLAVALSVSAEQLLFGDTPDRIGRGTGNAGIPVEANAMLAKCLAVTEALEPASQRAPDYERRAAHLIEIYNTCLKTGRMPEDLHRLHTPPLSRLLYAGDSFDERDRRSKL